jgi:hypothetical protein
VNSGSLLQYWGDEDLKDEVVDNLTVLGVYGDPLPSSYASQYRMVLDIDGNGWSSRLLTLFAHGALVFRAAVQSSFLDGYIRPYEHYIPVRMDFSDLVLPADYSSFVSMVVLRPV